MLKAQTRSPVTASSLEKTITSAVQQSSSDCIPFIGVYVQYAPGHVSGANWSLKGVKYGKAPRAHCDMALEQIVRNLQGRYAIETIRSSGVTAAPAALTDLRRSFQVVSPLAAALKRMSRHT